MRQLAVLAPLLVIVAALYAWEDSGPAPTIRSATALDTGRRVATLASIPQAATHVEPVARGARVPVMPPPRDATRSGRRAQGADNVVRVRAIDATTEEPLAGVKIGQRGDGPYPPVHTDDDGWAEIRWATPNRSFFAHVEAEGYAEVSAPLLPFAVKTLRLRPYGTLRGVVVDRKTGAAVCGAKVSVLNSIAPGTETDSGGWFELQRFAFGAPEHLEITAAGYATQRIGIDGDPRTETVLELRAARRLFGRVLDHATGRPVARASIEAPGSRDRTDEHGLFDVEVLPTDEQPEVEVEVRARGFCDATARLIPSIHEVSIHLPRTATIEGELRNERGPVRGVTVKALDPPSASSKGAGVKFGDGLWIRSPRMSPGRDLTDEEGRFRIEGIVPGSRKMWLEATGRRGGRRSYVIDAPERPNGRTSLRLYPGCPEELPVDAKRRGSLRSTR